MLGKIETLVEAADELKIIADSITAWLDATRHLPVPPMMFMVDRGDRCHAVGCGPWVKTAKMLVSALAETIAAEDRAEDRRRSGGGPAHSAG
jgi:hypothetical protein